MVVGNNLPVLELFRRSVADRDLNAGPMVRAQMEVVQMEVAHKAVVTPESLK
jgi:hypothetical protein